MSGGFGAGFLKGTLIGLMGAAIVSVALPPPAVDPGGKTQVDLTTPSGSGFNTGRSDSDPVLPETDQSVAKESVSKPDTSASKPAVPIAGTTPASQPQTQTGTALPNVQTGEPEVALVTPSEDPSPAGLPPALGVPMPAIENPVADIPTSRLPSIETPAAEPPAKPVIAGGTADAGQQPDPQVQTSVDEQNGSALMRNKAVFENPEGRPLFAVVLIDAGAEGLDADILSTFTFPVSFAFDADAPESAARETALKTAGFEILALAPSGEQKLKSGATPADTDTALAALFARIPDAVALVDRPSGGLQQDTGLTDQVLTSLKLSGHGLLTYDQGLNAADQKAQRAGVRSGIVFRVLDREREKSETIKRYLDRAVLEAGKDGFVIVLGRSYPETVTALFSWAVSGKSAAVALAPLSAVLLAR